MIKATLITMMLTWTAHGQAVADFQASVRAAMAGSLEKQRSSVQRQASSATKTVAEGTTQDPSSSFYTVPWPAPAHFTPSSPASMDCEPMSKPELEKIVESASQSEGVSADLVRLVIGKESASKPCAVSPKGAQGLMQLMPATADELGVRDPFDPRQNVEGGARLLKRLLTKYSGDVALALGAYNAGSGRVDREGGVPRIPETMNYVSDILSRFRPE